MIDEPSEITNDITIGELAPFGAEVLASLLVDCATRDSDLLDRLRLLVAARQGPTSLAAMAASRIQALVDDPAFYDWQKAGILADRIDHLRVTITNGFDAPRVTTKLLADLVATSDQVMNGVDDSSGRVGGAYGDAITAWGAAWARIADRDAAALAALVLHEIDADSYGVKRDVLVAFVPALGSTGLQILRGLIQQELDKDTSSSWQWTQCLRQIADGLGDVDGFIAAVEMADHPERHAVDVASRLVVASRPEQALDWLDRAGTATGMAADVRIAALLALGREQEAQEIRWKEAAGQLRVEHFRLYADALPPEERTATHERAVAAALAHQNANSALGFLLDMPDAAAAEKLIISRHRDLDGRYYTTLLPQAKLLAADHPLAATLLYRVLAEAILDAKRSPAYHHAADYICIANRLSTRIDDWQGQETQDAFMARLRDEHRRKSAFWPTMAKAEQSNH